MNRSDTPGASSNFWQIKVLPECFKVNRSDTPGASSNFWQI